MPNACHESGFCTEGYAAKPLLLENLSMCVYKAKTAMPAARTRPPKLTAMLEAEPVEDSMLVMLPPVGLATPVEKEIGAEWAAVALLGMV